MLSSVFARAGRQACTALKLCMGAGKRFAATSISQPKIPLSATTESPVGDAGVTAASELGAGLPPNVRKWIGMWLMACGLTTAVTATAASLTCLSQSKWEVMSGTVPPTNPISARSIFERYKQQLPENANKQMTSKQFQNIWRSEYAHRMLGGLSGVAFFIPAVALWLKSKQLDRPLKRRLVLAGGLLACQGLLGWLLVRSNRADQHRAHHDSNTEVIRTGQYVLATYVSTALALVATFTYVGSTLMAPTHISAPRNLRPELLAKIMQARLGVLVCAALVFCTAFTGAKVSGLAGELVHQTYPKFDGRWIPTDLIDERMPVWRNFFENPSMSQFQHRLFAGSTGLAILATWWRYNRFMVTPAAKGYLTLALLLTMAQAGLGIATLMKTVPTDYAGIHMVNNGAIVIVLTLLMRHLHWVKRVARI